MDVEICIEANTAVSQNVAAAYRGGARRIELCAAMGQDGLTPDVAQIVAARQAFGERAGLLVMIRPRGGGFEYSRAEVDLMMAQMETAVSAGANGVVFGALQDDQLNLDVMRKMTHHAHNLGVAITCHRAFDAVSDPSEALEQLIALGVQRVLTSGTKWGSNLSAIDGVDQLTRSIQQANDRIEIVIGGGINLQNVELLLGQLPSSIGRTAVHAYSGVLRDGLVDETAVAQLVQKVQNFK